MQRCVYVVVGLQPISTVSFVIGVDFNAEQMRLKFKGFLKLKNLLKEKKTLVSLISIK